MTHAPEDINIGEVVRTIESFNLVECLGDESMCRIERDCRLAEAIVEAREAFLQSLERYTLADLVHPRKKLIKMLSRSGTNK